MEKLTCYSKESSGNGKDRERSHVETREDRPTKRKARLWWFPYPLIAGTFGPIASAFSICALSVPWRVLKTTDNLEEPPDYIDDPKWLIGINAAQLTLALISNLYLFLNMARRVRFYLAQPIVIIGWYMSSISLVVLTAIVGGSLNPPEYALTQAYFYAMFSAVLYFVVATMMVVTVFGFYKGHYDEEFRLTVSRRSLMIQTSSFMLYLLLGAAVFAHIEDWEYLDAVYWADYTVLTVGIGDFVPTTHLSRSLLFPFATGGVIIFGLVICTIRGLVIDRGKLKIGATHVEKLRQRALKKEQQAERAGIFNPFGAKITRTLRTAHPQGSRQEFELMRQIQDRAASRSRWSSLLFSFIAWFMLWFFSASIFKATEKLQGWSYFESLYFTFTSLLTIGYGDFHPVSSAGKAFFVFWSLLAVPTLTILISNMGDTIIKKIRDMLLWAGNLTIFVPEDGFKATVKRATYRMTRSAGFKVDIQGTQPRNVNNTSHGAQIPQHSKTIHSENATHDIILMEEMKGNGTMSGRPKKSIKDFHCLLLKEIGTVIAEIKSPQLKTYTFDEWLWYLEVLGEDKNGSVSHMSPDEILRVNGEPLTAVAVTRRETDEQEGPRAPWSWIGEESPLMADIGEPEWLLGRLLIMLEEELKNVKGEKP